MTKVRIIPLIILFSLILTHSTFFTSLIDIEEQNVGKETEPEVNLKPAAYDEIGPITITANDQFLANGFTGDGSSETPFVLSNKNITATGSGSDLISISDTTANFTISNCYLDNPSYSRTAITFSNVTNGIVENTIINKSAVALSIGTFSENIEIRNNTILDANEETIIEIMSCSNITLDGNTITGGITDSCIYVSNCKYTKLIDNTIFMDYCNYGIFIYSGISSCYYTEIINNSITEYHYRGIYLYRYAINTTISGNTIANGSGNGIYLRRNIYNTTIFDNTISNCTNFDGIYVYGDGESGYEINNTKILNNSITTCYRGIYVADTVRNTFISGNTMTNCSDTGIRVEAYIINIFISDNIISNCSLYGIRSYTTDNLNITGNIITNCTFYGIYLGVTVFEATVYYNYFIDNNVGNPQAYDEDDGTSNKWDNGTYGNYWSDYTGSDPESDGIGNSNYTLATSSAPPNNDTKPLVSNLQINELNDENIEAGPTTHTLTWNPTSVLRGYYTVYLETAPIVSDLWIHGNPLSCDIEIGGFSLDTAYNITVELTDLAETTVKDTVFLTLVDTTAPEISYTGPATISFDEGTLDHEFDVSASDLYPWKYFVYQNGTEVYNNTWVSNVGITVSLDDLPVGTHNITVVVKDTSGNQDVETVIVTVLEAEETTSAADETTSAADETSSKESEEETSTTSDAGTFPEFVLLVGSVFMLAVYTRKRHRK